MIPFLLLLWSCQAGSPTQSVRDGSWWVALSEWQRDTVVLGYSQYYRLEIEKPLTFSEDYEYADRLIARLKNHPEDGSRTIGELLDAEAAKSPPRTTPWQTYMTMDARGMETGEGWRQLLRDGQRLGFVQGYLECVRRHPKPGLRFSKDEAWYVLELSKWYGVKETDDEALRSDRADVAIVDALRLLKDK